jgi:hypothetical protein
MQRMVTERRPVPPSPNLSEIAVWDVEIAAGMHSSLAVHYWRPEGGSSNGDLVYG